ncbi:MAG: cytochrome c [Gammaproteobacteria bacterium]|nr:cytochrome c [Gammaproteobacteria bacterium]
MKARKSIIKPLMLLLALPLASTAADTHGDSTQGKAHFNYWCAPCHAAGPGHPGTQSLTVKYRGSVPAELEQRKDLTAALLTSAVRQGILSMPPFRKTEVSDAQLADLIAYLTTR